MRPLKLTMQAFGPYANRVTVDFDKLGNKGVYLITGDTGSGKTTIFDGISYALFDKTSLEERDASQLRSKYAPEELSTEVELTFLYDDKEYSVKRTPQYKYVNKNGVESTKPSTVELTLPKGKVFSGKKKETDSKIKEIIGLEYDQFKRIVMIAQGDFKQLLLDKAGRIEIFRKIFDTNYLLDIQDQLKEERKQLKQDCKDGQSSISQYFDEIYYDEDDDLSIELEELDDTNIDEINKVVTKINKCDEKLIASIDKDLKENGTQLAQVNQKLGLAKKYREFKDKLDKATKLKTSINQELSKAKTELEKLKKQKPAITAKEKELVKLESELKKYETVDKKQEALDNLLDKLETSRSNKDKQEKLSKTTKKTIEAIQKQLDAFGNVEAELTKLNSELDAGYSIQESLEDLSEQYETLNTLTKDLDLAQKDYIKKTEEANKLREKYETLNQLFLDNQAGILARSLVNNKPCPVCGSLEHPNPAKVAIKAPTETELKKIKAQVELFNSNEKSASAKASKIVTQLEECKKAVLKLSKRLLKCDDIEKIGKLLDAELSKMDKLIETLENKIEKLENNKEKAKKLSSDLKKQQDAYAKCEKSVNDLNTKISADEASFKAKEKEIKELTKSLKYDCLDDAEEAYDELSEEIDEFNKSYESTNKENQELAKQLVSYTTQVDEYTNQLKDVVKVDDKPLVNKKDILDEEKEELTEQLKEVTSRYKINTKALNNLNKAYKAIESTEKKLEWVNVLCDTANGTLNGKDKITFETYIQMSYFDRILVYGNSRLEIMTNGQYSFVRGEEGLDLSVIDHYNGTTREVSTLSGGESFMAALSLALGMSDEVQARASSVQIDTMFVDEGFGSLDNDSLSKALDSLQELSEGNRLVGVISHIPELKNRIDKKIVVTKNKAAGSEIKLEL